VTSVTQEKLRPFNLSEGERDRRWRAVRSEMAARGLDCLIIWGSTGLWSHATANLRWMTDTNVDGYLLFPATEEPTLFTSEDGLNPSWVTDWRGGGFHLSRAIAPRIRDLHLERGSFGVAGLSGIFGELDGFPYAAYTNLAAEFPHASFEDATDLIEEMRKIKSAEEIRAIETGCAIIEKVFQTICEIADAGVPDYEIRAAIMDTLFRNGSEPGSLILYCQGKELIHGGQSGVYFEPPFTTPLEAGDVILLEIDAIYLGYKAQFNHAFCVGEVDEEWGAIFQVAAESFREGLRVLRSGVSVGELEDALLRPIKDAGFLFANPPFHGLGLALEPPIGSYPRVGWHADRDETLKENMILEFEPHPVSSSGKRGASIGCPVLVTSNGCRVLPEWYTPTTLSVGSGS
jgi:Xaa-Pro aminopeptidase